MGNLSNKILITKPIEEIMEQVNESDHCIIIAGEKGRGKTTVARHILSSNENCLYLESSDFDFLCQNVNEKELIHFMELTLSKKIFTYLVEKEQIEEYQSSIEILKKELETFYQTITFEEKHTFPTYDFMGKTLETLNLINKSAKEVTFVFDDFHKIPKNIREIVKQYNRKFNTGIITIDYDKEIIDSINEAKLINLDYSNRLDFTEEFISNVLYHRGVNHLKDSSLSHEYNTKIKNQYLEMLSDGYLEAMINHSKGNLHELRDSLLAVISTVNTNGYDYTKKTLAHEYKRKF